MIIAAAQSAPGRWNVLGFVDPAPCERTATLAGVPRLGDDAAAIALAQRGVAVILGVGAVGSSAGRRAIVARYDAAGVSWAAVVHERAWIAPGVVVGGGSFVGPGAIVNGGTRLGAHCVIN